MTRFDEELDDAFEALKAELRREPNSDETDYLRDRQFKDWIEAGRFDELIDYIHDTHELGGGFGDCDILSEALRKRGDRARSEKLFDGLVASRNGTSSDVFSLISHQSTILGASDGSMVQRYPLRSAAPCQFGRKRNFLSAQPKPLAKRASSSGRSRSRKKPVLSTSPRSG